MIYAYITCPDTNEAKRIAKILLEKRLIGCANIFPIESMYWGKERIEEKKEIALIAKTSVGKFESMRKEVLAIHPYDVPCIAKIPVQPNDEYASWLQDALAQTQ